MNLPTLARVLGEHQVKRIYGSSKIIRRANELISNTEYEFTSDMTGIELNIIYKELVDLDMADILISEHVVAESEDANILHQIEMLGIARDATGMFNDTTRLNILTYLAVSIALMSVVMCTIYSVNAKSLDSDINSNVVTILTRLISEYQTVEQTGYLNPDEFHKYEDNKESAETPTPVE